MTLNSFTTLHNLYPRRKLKKMYNMGNGNTNICHNSSEISGKLPINRILKEEFKTRNLN